MLSRIDEPEEPTELMDAVRADTPAPSAGVSDLERVNELTSPVDSTRPPPATASLDQPPSNESGSPPPFRQLRSATRHTSLAPGIVHGDRTRRGVR